jgi:hypothetical protein
MEFGARLPVGDTMHVLKMAIAVGAYCPLYASASRHEYEGIS